MTNEQAIKWLKDYIQNTPFQMEQYERAFEMAIKALSQVSEIEENIIKYMKKYPNHVGNTDFWEGFYACRNVVLQLDDEEYSPKEQEPCDDAISRQAVLKLKHHKPEYGDMIYAFDVEQLPSVTQKSGKWIRYKDNCLYNQCSYCGASHCREDNYCPNCGAKMVEPQERSE